MKKIHSPFNWKGIGCYPYFLSFLCLILWTPLQAQLPSGEQTMVEQAIENTTQQIPLLQPFLNAMNLGDPVVITNTASTFKFKKERVGVPFSTILNDLATAVGGTQLSSVLNNPVMTNLSQLFPNNTIIAEFTINNVNSSSPGYTVSLLGTAAGLELEFFLGKGANNTDFVLAIAPGQMNFGTIHNSLSVFNDFGTPSFGIFLTKPGAEITPEMAILSNMGLEGLELSNPLTAVANVSVTQDSDFGKAFQIENFLATAAIPGDLTSPLELKASMKPNWSLGSDLSISDLTIGLNFGINEGSLEVETFGSLTFDTNLPSDAIGNLKSEVSWTGEVSISVGQDGPGIGVTITGSAAMGDDETWNTPFGFNELDIKGGGAELGISVTVRPGTPVIVTVTPDLGLRGNISIGRNRLIGLSMGGQLNFSDIYSSGVNGQFQNVGLGTILSELYLDAIGGGISAAQLKMLDTVFLSYGQLSLFPVGGTIAGRDYEAGVVISGRGKAFGIGCDVNFFFDPNGVSGDLTISPIHYALNDTEVFSLRGTNTGDSLRAAINIQFNSLASQLINAANGIPLLMADAQVGLLGASSQTKLVLNPVQGSYFSTNSKLLDELDVKMEGEMKSLTNFGDMKIRAALDKAPTEKLTNALRQHLEKTVSGLFPIIRVDEINTLIPAKIADLGQLREQVQNERDANITAYQQRKNNLENTLSEFHRLDSLAKLKWAQHEALPWGHWDRIGLWFETTDLNAQRDAVFVGVRIAQAAFDVLAWINTLPPIELDPRITALKIEIQNLQIERAYISKLHDLSTSIFGKLKEANQYFIENGIYNLADVKQVEFEGELALLSGGEFNMMLNMIFMGNEISLNSKVSIKNDKTIDVSNLIDDLLNGRYTNGFSPTFATEIGTKYNYSTTISSVNEITAPLNDQYNPPIYNPNPAPIGTAGNTVGLDTHAMTFNGTSDYQEKAGSWGNWTEMTIEAWVKSNGSNGGFQTIVSGNEGFVHFQMAPDGVGNNAVYLSNGLVILLPVLPDATTEWRHVAIVVKSGASKVYQNGELIGQPNYLGFGGATIIPTNNIRIGSNQTYGRYLNGDLADVRIWNKARTQTEIKAGMHEVPSMNTPGLVAAYIVDMVTPEVISQLEARTQTFNSQTNITTPGHITQNLTAMTIEAWVKNEADLENIQAIVSSPELNFAHLQSSDDANVSSAVYVNTGEIYFPAVPKSLGQWQHVVMVVQSGNSQLYINGEPYGPHSTKTFSSINPAPIVQIGKGFQGSRAFNGKIANVRIWNSAKTPANLLANAQGSSPNNSNELLYFSPTSNPLSITSVNDCVPLPDDLAAGVIQSLTIEAWINNSSVQNDIQAILSADGPEFVHLQMSGDGNVKNAVYLNDGGSMMLPVIPALTPGWHHVALVVESGNTRVYLDAEQIGSTNTTAFTGLKPCPSVFIGKGWAGGRVFNGKIADVRIWKNRALTQSQIATYRHTPPPASANSLVYHYK